MSRVKQRQRAVVFTLAVKVEQLHQPEVGDFDCFSRGLKKSFTTWCNMTITCSSIWGYRGPLQYVYEVTEKNKKQFYFILTEHQRRCFSVYANKVTCGPRWYQLDSILRWHQRICSFLSSSFAGRRLSVSSSWTKRILHCCFVAGSLVTTLLKLQAASPPRAAMSWDGRFVVVCRGHPVGSPSVRLYNWLSTRHSDTFPLSISFFW